MNSLIWSPGDQVLVWTFNILIQIALIAAFALIIGVTLRRSSAARYWLLCSALFLVFLCPVFSAVIQKSGTALISVSLIQNISVPDQGQLNVATTLPTNTDIANVPLHKPSEPLVQPEEKNVVTAEKKIALASHEDEALTTNEKGIQQIRDEAISTTPIVTPTLLPLVEPSTTNLGRFLRIVVPLGLIIWICGALLLLIQLSMKCYRLSLLLKSTNENTNEIFEDTFHQAWLSLKCNPGRKKPELVFSNEISGPIAAGISSPKVVLPESLVNLISTEQLRGILIHEVAHIARGDQLIVLLQNIIGAIFWVHPFVRLLNRQIAQAREEVCDNYVLAATDAPSYCLTLLKLAQMLNAPRPIPGTVGLFTSRWKLEQRVTGLLDEQRSRVTRLSKPTRTFIGAVSVGLAATAAFGTVSLAVAENVEAPIDQQNNATQESPLNQPKDLNVSIKNTVVEGKTKTTKTPSDQHFVYTGRAVNSQGQPIAGATINVVYSGYALRHPGSSVFYPYHKQLAKVHTNVDGAFRLEFDDEWTRYVRASGRRPNHSSNGPGPGTVIIASALGHAPEWISSFDADPDKPLQIMLRENTQPIQGHLVNLEGRGIAGITVSLVSLWSAEDGAVDRWLHELPKIRKQGLLPSAKTDIMSDSFNATIGRFPVYSHVISNTPGVPTMVQTDREGRFQFPHIGSDRLAILKIEGPQIATQRIAVVSREMQPVQTRSIGYRGPNDTTHYGATFTHVTEPGLVVEGVVRDQDTGTPISAQLMILRHGSRMISKVDFREWKTDPKGKYHIEGLPIGSKLILKVTPDVDQPYFEEQTTLPKANGLAPITLEVKLRRGVMFHGTITDKQTGKPIPNASFDYFPLLTNKNADQYLRYQDDSTSLEPMNRRFNSAEDGSFSLVGIPGKGIIAARINNPEYLTGIGLENLHDLIDKKGKRLLTHDHCHMLYQTLKLVTVPPGESEMDVELQADRGESIRFEVVGPDDKPLTDYFINSQRDNNVQGNQSIVYGFQPSRTRTVYFVHHEKNLARAVTIPGVPNDRSIRKIKLEPMGAVKGQLVTKKSIPLSDARIYMQREAIPGTNSLPTYDNSNILHQTNCDQKGKFHIPDLMVGAEYTVHMSRPYHRLTDRFKVKPGQTIDLGVIKIPSKE